METRQRVGPRPALTYVSNKLATLTVLRNGRLPPQWNRVLDLLILSFFHAHVDFFGYDLRL
jgi:hypothetical protein